MVAKRNSDSQKRKKRKKKILERVSHGARELESSTPQVGGCHYAERKKERKSEKKKRVKKKFFFFQTPDQHPVYNFQFSLQQ